MTASHTLTSLSRARSAWLEDQSAAWLRQGLVDADTRDRILASYEVQSAERRGLLALMLLGALMFGIGVLLLIGYNWDRLPVNGKIAIIMSSVALAFAGSAVTYARQHRLAGEILAFIGVLLYGNAIWLIAQVLHIRGNFPDAFMWWAIGALVCAWLVRSRVIGVAAAVLVFVWIGVAADQVVGRPGVSFVAVLAATLALAYAQKSRVMLAAAAVSLMTWACWLPAWVQPDVISVGAAALTGCAFYGIGAWHQRPDPMGRAWQVAGLVTLVVLFVPLLITDFHNDAHRRAVTWRALVVMVPSLLVAASLLLRGSSVHARRRSSPGDLMIVATTVILAIVAGASWSRRRHGFSVGVRVDAGLQPPGTGVVVLIHPHGARPRPRIRSDVRRALRARVPARAVGEPHRQHAVVRRHAAHRQRRLLCGRAPLAGPRPPAAFGVVTRTDRSGTMIDKTSQPLRTAIAGAICLSILSGILVVHAWPLWTGQAALLPVTPIDPRDLFRGEYVRLDTPATRLSVRSESAAPADALAVTPVGSWWTELPADEVQPPPIAARAGRLCTARATWRRRRVAPGQHFR